MTKIYGSINQHLERKFLKVCRSLAGPASHQFKTNHAPYQLIFKSKRDWKFFVLVLRFSQKFGRIGHSNRKP